MPPEQAKIRVLLVDDEELICRTLERLLRQGDRFEVYTALSYAVARRVFDDKGPFDVLLTDLRLPDISGVELAERFLAKQPSLKVVFMSGDIPPNFKGRGHAIAKPFDRAELVNVLEVALDDDPPWPT